MSNSQQWFETWFDSPYYHILYKNRNGEEAKKLLNNLVSKLELKPGMRVMDLCCGNGRHEDGTQSNPASLYGRFRRLHFGIHH